MTIIQAWRLPRCGMRTLRLRPPPPRAWWRPLLAASWWIALALSLPACASLASGDGPDRLGRIAVSQGPVSLSRAAPGPGEPALPPGAQLDVDTQRDGLADGLRNWPLASGDRLRTGPNATAELGIGATRWRLAERSELWVLRLDDERILLRLARGSLAWAVVDPAIAADIEVSTGRGSAQPLGSGVFRVQADAARWSAASWQGQLRLEQPGTSLTLQPGQAADSDGQGGWRLTGIDRLPMHNADDRAEFDWMRGIDLAAERAALQPLAGAYGSSFTGREDLGAYGSWENSPQWGTVWYPSGVVAGWAPYQQGRWVWAGAGGWSWVDPAPWGFTTSHYGRWVRNVDGRWGWLPGPRVIPRPPQPARPGGPPPAWAGPPPQPRPPRGARPGVPAPSPPAQAPPAPPPNVIGPRPPWTQPAPGDRRPHERVQPAPPTPAPPGQEEDRRVRIPTPIRAPAPAVPPVAAPVPPAPPAPMPPAAVQPQPRPPDNGGFIRRVMPPPPPPPSPPPTVAPAAPPPAAPRREERRVERPAPPERSIPGRAQ